MFFNGAAFFSFNFSFWYGFFFRPLPWVKVH